MKIWIVWLGTEQPEREHDHSITGNSMIIVLQGCRRLPAKETVEETLEI